MTAAYVDISANTSLTAALVLLPGPLMMREACKIRQLELCAVHASCLNPLFQSYSDALGDVQDAESA